MKSWYATCPVIRLIGTYAGHTKSRGRISSFLLACVRRHGLRRNLMDALNDCVLQMCYTLAMRLRKHIVLRIDEKSLKAVQRIAKQEDESVARIIRRAIVAFVERYKRK